MSDDEQANSPWNVIKRVIAGKPAFLTVDTWLEKSGRLKRRAAKVLPSKKLVEPPPAQNTSPVPVAVNPLRDKQGNKIIPELLYQRYDDRIYEDMLDLWLQFKNISNVTLEIRYAELFGLKTPIGKVLLPNEVEKFQAYRGKLPANCDQCHARIVYRELLSGIKDVFRTEYIVHFQQYHDNTHYTVHNFVKNGPARNW